MSRSKRFLASRHEIRRRDGRFPADERVTFRTTFWYINPGRLLTLQNPSHTLLDIVKVRLQTSTKYKSALDGATQIFKNEGPSAFYKVLQPRCEQPSRITLMSIKGTLTPLIGIGACVSFSLFGPTDFPFQRFILYIGTNDCCNSAHVEHHVLSAHI